MKSIKVTFKLSPYQLAKGLQTIRQLEPKYKLISINDIVKVCYHDFIAKMNMNRSDDVPYDLVDEITAFRTERMVTLDDLLDLSSDPTISPEQTTDESPDPTIPTPEPETITDPIAKSLAELAQQKASAFNDPNTSDSDISALTDFSPPADWKE